MQAALLDLGIQRSIVMILLVHQPFDIPPAEIQFLLDQREVARLQRLGQGGHQVCNGLQMIIQFHWCHGPALLDQDIQPGFGRGKMVRQSLQAQALQKPRIAILERQIGNHHRKSTEGLAETFSGIGLALANLILFLDGCTFLEQVIIQGQIDGLAFVKSIQFKCRQVPHPAQGQGGTSHLAQAFGIGLTFHNDEIGVTGDQRPVHLAFARQVAGFVIRINRVQGTRRKIGGASVPDVWIDDIPIG